MSTRWVETTEDNMAGIAAFLKNAWNKEPVILASCAIGLIGFALPLISPITKYTGMINSSVPYNYPGKHTPVILQQVVFVCHCKMLHNADACETALGILTIYFNTLLIKY
uniref:NADH dehydrogenase [ubiquinone] 1 alpha subcomplex subunit 3 n=1 Tax=Sander lucioperca TaxID=283035 RepID=A0A8C9Z875_SANLU